MDEIRIVMDYDLEMCAKNTCTPLSIPIHSDFRLASVGVDSSHSPLATACKVKVTFGNEIVYHGMIGSEGFTLSVVDIDEGANFDIKMSTDCSLLVDLADNLEPLKVKVTGFMVMEESEGLSRQMQKDWA